MTITKSLNQKSTNRKLRDCFGNGTLRHFVGREILIEKDGKDLLYSVLAFFVDFLLMDASQLNIVVFCNYA